ncbi:MAG: hypothetical protein JKY09_07220 [Crocinitomicaceae bacterium]|nr:hypothetical protein [Crocinitomicaceae bacterium]
MKYVLLLFLGSLLVGCGTRVPYTNQVRDDFGLETEQTIKKVQFLVSTDIILQRSSESGDQGTDESGTLVVSSNKEQDRIIIPNGTKGLFEGFGDNGELIVRFEVGVGKTLTFGLREGQTAGKYYIMADWKNKKGGEIQYGNQTYYVAKQSGTAYLQVLKKKLQKTKRKDRVVKGLKI